MLTREQLREAALVLQNEGDFHAHYCTKGSRMAAPYGRRGSIYNALRKYVKHLWSPSTERCAEALRLYLDSAWGIPIVRDPDYPDICYDFMEDDVAPPRFNWMSLPDGAHMVDKTGRIWVKGPHPCANWVRTRNPDHFVGYLQAHEQASAPDWEVWQSDGTTPSGAPAYALVNYNLPPTQPSTPTPEQEQPTMIDSNAIVTITTKTLVNGHDVADLTNTQIYEIIAAQEAAIERLQGLKSKPKKLVEELAARQAGIEALVAAVDSRKD